VSGTYSGYFFSIYYILLSVTALSVHMNSVHTGVKNFPCSDCEKKFKSNYDLTRHRATVHLGQKPACPYCGKRLANMRQHIRVVHKQIRFPCDICKKQLTTRSELKKHTASAHYPAEQGAAGGALEYQCEDQMIQQYLGRHQFGLEGLAWPDSGASSPIHPSIHP
jgi:DNA-directed RNA polymerase subunit RPC12/RpoP